MLTCVGSRALYSDMTVNLCDIDARYIEAWLWVYAQQSEIF